MGETSRKKVTTAHPTKEPPRSWTNLKAKRASKTEATKPTTEQAAHS